MNCQRKQEEIMRELSPEVARFVRQVFAHLEQENVFDAPTFISGVLRRMHLAESEVIRGAAGRTERLLKATFARGCLQRVGA